MSENELMSRIADLAARVAVVEARQEIADLITRYGPAIDAGDAEAVARLWTPDGVYDVDTGLLRGRDEIAAMVRGGMHRDYLSRGCAHIVEPPQVIVDGDVAIATGKSLLVAGDGAGGRFVVARATANRWELERIDGRWWCARRVARLITGGPEPRAVLAAGVGPRRA